MSMELVSFAFHMIGGGINITSPFGIEVGLFYEGAGPRAFVGIDEGVVFCVGVLGILG